MLALLRFCGDSAVVAEAADHALAVLGAGPGFRWGGLARGADDAEQWLLVTVWEDAGSMRRGLGSYQAKVALGPLQAASVAGSGVFELLAEYSGSGEPVRRDSERAADADTAGPGRST